MGVWLVPLVPSESGLVCTTILVLLVEVLPFWPLPLERGSSVSLLIIGFLGFGGVVIISRAFSSKMPIA